jgi:hypothetical protein
LQDGFKFLADGLAKYFDPSTYLAGASVADVSAATTTDASSLFGSLGDPGGLLAELTSLMPNLGTDLASMAPQLSADLSSSFPDLAATLIP